MAEHFYVTLPSNSSEAYFGRQQAGHYHTRLAVPIRVDPQDYEVGLAEVLLPRALFNVAATTIDYTFVERPEANFKVHIPTGHYKSVPHLIHTMNDERNNTIDTRDSVLAENDFTYSDVTGRVTCTVATGFQVTFPDNLSIVLGFGNAKKTRLGGAAETHVTPDMTHLKGNVAVGEFEANVNRLKEVLMVYSDIVAPQYVGGQLVPLLRHVTCLNAGSGDVTEERFTHVHYVALQRACLDTITIFYADATGNPPTFTAGTSMVKLHFRPKR